VTQTEVSVLPGSARASAPPSLALLRRLIAVTVGLFVVRLALSAFRSGPVIVADEIGYLMNARVLAGGTPGQLQLAAFYHGGYSLLASPLLDLTSQPGVAYHLVLALNAVLAASLFPLLYVLLTRCATMAPRTAIGPALAGAVYPSVTVLSGAAMSENALFPLTCVWLIACCRLLSAREQPRAWIWAVAVGTSAAALWAVHGRMISAVILTTAVAAALGVQRRLRLRLVLIVLAVMAAGLWATHGLDTFLVSHNYGGHVANEADVRLSALLHVHALPTVAENLVGQSWYLIVSTFGLAAVVVAGALRAPAGVSHQAREVVLILLALTALLLLVSAVSFTDRTRPDMLIYGRYVAVAVPPLVALGLAMLISRQPMPKLRHGLVALAVLTAIVAVFRAASGPLRPASRWNVADLPFVTIQLGPSVLIGAAVVAGIGAWLLTRASARRPAIAWAVAAGLFLAIIVYGVENPLLQAQHSVYPSRWRDPTAVASAYGIRSVAYNLDHFNTVGSVYTNQWFLPYAALVFFHAGRQNAPSRYVVSDPAWPREHPATRAMALWTSPNGKEVLWHLRG